MKMTCPKCGKLMEPQTVNWATVVGSLGAGGAGAAIGSSIGIAALGTAIAATIPLAGIGAGLGYLALRNMRQCPICKSYFSL